MTEVYYTTQGEDLKLIEILGHANYADKGKDIVCSAISILTYTLREALDTLPSDQVKAISRFQEGCVHFLVATNGTTTAETRTRIETMLTMILEGYKLIEAEYSDHIRVHFS